MTRFSIMIATAAAVLLPTTGCGSFGDIWGIFQPSVTTVRLVNTNDTFSVHVELYYGDDQNTLEAILTAVGTKREITIEPNGVQTFTVDCDDLQAIIIDRAALQIIAGIGPEADTGVYRDGTDFGCGDTLVFTFTGSLLDLDISFTQQ